MLSPSAFGKSLVSDEFNLMCTEAKVEARVQPFPNPGDPMRSMRLITFTNYNKIDFVTITEQSGKAQSIGPKQTLLVMVAPNESLPVVSKGMKDA